MTFLQNATEFGNFVTLYSLSASPLVESQNAAFARRRQGRADTR